MAVRLTRSRRVKVQSGETAVAPRVDDPRGFAVRNRSGQELTVSFEYDARAHVQVVTIEEPRPHRRIGGELNREQLM